MIRFAAILLCAFASHAVDLQVRSELRVGGDRIATNQIWWESFDPTNGPILIETINFTNVHPSAPSGLRVSWYVPGRIAISTNLLDWTVQTEMVACAIDITNNAPARYYRVPLDLTVVRSLSTNSATINWDPPALVQVDRFNVYYGTATTTNKVSLTGTAYTVTNIQPGIEYWFAITSEAWGLESEPVKAIRYRVDLPGTNRLDATISKTP